MTRLSEMLINLQHNARVELVFLKDTQEYMLSLCANSWSDKRSMTELENDVVNDLKALGMSHYVTEWHVTPLGLFMLIYLKGTFANTTLNLIIDGCEKQRRKRI